VKPHKSQSDFNIIKASIILLLIIIVAIGSFFFWYYHTFKTTASSCEPTAAIERSGSYAVPCQLIMSVKGPPYPTQSSLQKLVKPIHGNVSSLDPADGVFQVTVKAGTEEKSINFLRTQSLVITVSADHCCSIAQ
jgi:hypothetical protein